MFSFLKNRTTFYGIALALVVISLLAIIFIRPNLGIDLTGWVQLEYSCTTCSVDTVKAHALKTQENMSMSGVKVINDIMVYEVTGQNSIVVEAWFSKAKTDDATLEKLKTEFKDTLSTKLEKEWWNYALTRHVNIGESFGDYIKNSAYITLILAILAISLYIQYAFRGSIAGMASWPFAVVTGVSLIHDVIIAVWLYIIISHFFPEYKIDTFSLTAVLTVLGYSINDTIVVMDRIRSNLHESGKKVTLSSVIDHAISSTLTRSIYTSLTIVIVLLAMFFFGPSTLHGFMLMLLLGTIVGTYSSVCIAAPLLYDLINKK